MKNLFKNLMLVAVAAMAFTACQNDNNEVNEVAKKTVISGVLNIENEDTRSGFTGSYTEGDKTFYQSKWDGGETIKIYIDGCGSVFTTVDAEGRFEVAVDGEIPSGTAMYVCSPADAWNSQWTPTIPTEQTPRANSVDPAAHILQSIGATVASSMITMSPQQACYGKMTVNAPENFEIKKVEVSFNGGQVYTLNATNVENNVFWFAVDSMIDVTTFTVTAYDAENNAITKTVDVAAAGKTLKFQWGHVSTFSVSDLEAVVAPEEPKALVFTSAKWVNSSYSDKLVQFYTEDGGTLQLNWYKCGSDAWIVPNTYGFASSGAIYGGGEYSWYENSAAGIDTEIVDGTVIVSVVDGQYYIEFKNLADYSAVQIESATFTGQISGLQVPDMRTALPKPTNVQVSVVGRTISVSWDAVDGADGYLFELYSPYDEKFTEIVEGTTFSFTGLNSLYYYYFKLSAYASDENPNYRNSEEIYLEARTEDTDPKMEVSESKLAFSADGGEKTFNVTLKNTDAEITYTQEGDWFSVEMSGNTFTVTAEANESETDARDGSITVTAGELSQTITITQSKKPAASTSGADGTSVAKAYTFTSYSTYKDSGYPVMCLSGAENGATFNFESNSSNGFPTGMHKFNDGAWYPALCEYNINGEAQAVDFVNSVIWVEGNNVNGYTVEYIYIVTEDGNGIYYKYDGKFFM